MLLLALPVQGRQQLPPGGTFVDDDGTIYEPSIEALVASGITRGCTEDRYCPTDPVTRGQMASFLARSLTGLEPTDADLFPDDEGSVHEEDIDLIAANGIARGYQDGTFGPDDPVTRGQMASFLARGLGGLEPTDEDFFPDDEGSVHEEDIDVLAANGIVQGFPDGTYRPDTPLDRGEMAIMLVQALGLTPVQPPPRPIPADPIAAVDGQGRVVLIDAATGTIARVLLDGVPVDDPAKNGIALAPDHGTVYVAVPGEPGQGRIVAITLPEGQATDLARGSAPAVSPDGSTLAYVALEEGDLRPEPVIVLHDLETGSEVRRLRGADDRSTFVFIADLEWTGDGTGLAFVAGEIQTGAYLLDVAASEDLGDATRLGPTAREEGSSWYELAPFQSGLAVAERCCGVPGERHIVLLLSLEPLTVEGPLLPGETAVSRLNASGDSTLVMVGALDEDLTGRLLRWEGGVTDPVVLAQDVVVADG